MSISPSFLHPVEHLASIRAQWIPRLPNVDVNGERAYALDQLRPHHEDFIHENFSDTVNHHYAEQIHGSHVAIILPSGMSKRLVHPEVDGLLTRTPKQLLGIYVADCAAIYLFDPITRSIGLLHSGKKGTEANILAQAVTTMSNDFGTDPKNLICIVSPCIRPPDYEMNIAAIIQQQAFELGIQNFHDSHENTAQNLSTNYSYRVEKGKTGRMLALLSLV